ncbi:MAG TPA: prolyl oligopeptidase family serine peptidase [Usitatibacter sp.]|nr:prolyl oligopeptidase family serine peptidase [Usitatibacter sp.]
MKGTPILWGVAIAFAALAHGADVPGAAPAPASPAVASAQRSPARELLDRIPGRAALLARIRALGDASPAVRDLSVEAGRVFYLKTAAHAPGPVLCVRDGFEGAERVLVDPLARADGGPGTTIAWYSASPDGHHVAFGLGRDALAGTAVLHVLDVDHGRDLPFEIDRAAQNGHLAWQPDGKSFYYARAPEAQAPGAEGAHVRIYRHVLGRETARDEVVFAPGVGGARDIPEMVEPRLVLPRESRYAFALVRSRPGAPVAVHVALQKELAAGRPRWHEIATTADEVVAIEAWHDDLYLLTHRGATNRRVLRVAAGAEDLAKAKVAVPEGDAVIEAMGLARDGMYLRTMVAGVDRLERMRFGLLASGTREFLRLPYDMAIAELVTDPRRNGAVLRLDGWTRPPEVAEVDARTGDVRNTNLVAPAAADYSSIDEVRLYAPAPDGTRIPVTLLYERSTRLTADNPTLLTVYGAWGDPASPVFDAARLAWLERGGVFAVAHVRGGGEYGDAWHEAARGATKARTVSDFIAVCEFLERYGFTNNNRLAIEGMEAGGIPVGDALVRRPDLFAAAILRDPILDLAALESSAAGRAQLPEFGSAASAEDRARLAAISPYAQVRDGMPYPAVLLSIGVDAPGVDPSQARRMAARLEHATTSGKPALLRVDSGLEPGPRARREEELADVYSFALWQLGDPQFQPAPPAPPQAPAKAFVHGVAPGPR